MICVDSIRWCLNCLQLRILHDIVESQTRNIRRAKHEEVQCSANACLRANKLKHTNNLATIVAILSDYFSSFDAVQRSFDVLVDVLM